MREKRSIDGNWDAEKRRNNKRYRTEDGWSKTAIARIRYRAKKKGIDFNLDVDDIKLPEFCPVLGMRLVIGNGVSARNAPDAPSIDRFDNSLGYVKGNIRVISNRANILKSDATIEEFTAVLAYMRGEVS